VTFKDLGKQVTPRTFGLSKKLRELFHRHHQWLRSDKAAVLDPLASHGVNHRLGASSPQPSVVAAAAVLRATPLSRRGDPVGAKDTSDLLATELNLLVFFELLGQIVIVKSLVLPPG
jgi:hypothetical protein